MVKYDLQLQPQFFEHAESEIFRPSGRRYDAVGHRLFQFSFGCPCLLRDREVFLQSGGTVHRHGTPYPDQFAGLGVEDLFIVVIEYFLVYFHGHPSFREPAENLYFSLPV